MWFKFSLKPLAGLLSHFTSVFFLIWSKFEFSKFSAFFFSLSLTWDHMEARFSKRYFSCDSKLIFFQYSPGFTSIIFTKSSALGFENMQFQVSMFEILLGTVFWNVPLLKSIINSVSVQQQQHTFADVTTTFAIMPTLLFNLYVLSHIFYIHCNKNGSS